MKYRINDTYIDDETITRIPSGGVALTDAEWDNRRSTTFKTQAEIDSEASALARIKLSQIDEKSIRSIREYIAAKADAPAFLKTYEAQAQAERAKVKP